MVQEMPQGVGAPLGDQVAQRTGRQVALNWASRNARLLVPLTRGQGGAALQFEVELGSLDQLERVRHGGGDPGEEVASLMRAFSEILLAPPGVEILRVDEVPAS